MTSQAPHHKVVALFNGLLRRAEAKQNCLSLQSMALAYDFDDPAQAQNALDRLVQSGHIRIDIGGKYPALRIVKGHYKALHECRAKVLSPAKIEAGQASHVPPAPPRIITSVPTPDPLVPAKPLVESGRVVSIPDPTPVSETAFKPAPPEPANGGAKQVNFRVSAADYEWLQEQLEKTSEPMSMSGLVKDMLEVEILRRRAEDTGKFRVSAAVVRAAQKAGQPLDRFITNLLELGLRARQAEAARQ